MFENVFHEIHDAEKIPPFFMTLTSSDEKWIFVSSNGGICAGVSKKENAIFPYSTEDKIIENACEYGPLTIIRIIKNGKKSPENRSFSLWEPFNPFYRNFHEISLTISKNIPGNILRFEERNKSLGIVFSYSWTSSRQFGFIRSCEIKNESGGDIELEILDGVRNIVPPDLQYKIQTATSVLGDAYKRNELLPSGLALYTLNSIPCDKAEPMESLRANSFWQYGLQSPKTLLSSTQADNFRKGLAISTETETRGVKGAFLISTKLRLRNSQKKSWLISGAYGMTQDKIVALELFLKNTENPAENVREDIVQSTCGLEKLVAMADGIQSGGDKTACAHHFSNTTFNIMRGGIFIDAYRIGKNDFLAFIAKRNAPAAKRSAKILAKTQDFLSLNQLKSAADDSGDPDLRRLVREYLPLTFGRRHGDPSRPWNEFEIRTFSEDGKRIIGYQGNWRDIFQNWEALALSFPLYLESMISKFINATNLEGYNPYRLSQNGLDWEKEDKDDPWSNIGYWSDHQIIYLLRLLELEESFHPGALTKLMDDKIFSSSNLPYRIKSAKDLLANPRDTIVFDMEKDARLERETASFGSDAKLLKNESGVLHFSMMEKILCLILAKFANFIPGGGIWMNTQRPEWNDANNALAGWGLSAVTLFQLNKFLTFLESLISKDTSGKNYAISEPILRYLSGMERHLTDCAKKNSSFSDPLKLANFAKTGQKLAQDFRDAACYGTSPDCHLHRRSADAKRILDFLRTCRESISNSMPQLRGRKLFDSYKILSKSQNGGMKPERLHEMLEGQVSVLASGSLSFKESIRLLRDLRGSDMYCQSRRSYILYPDKEMLPFLERNIIDSKDFRKSALFAKLAELGDSRIIVRDPLGNWRFSHGMRNSALLEKALDGILAEKQYCKFIQKEKQIALEIYEKVFRHSCFLGRSGTFFCYEGLGSIYWHMVSKLLLATQELGFAADEAGDRESAVSLRDEYFAIRSGLGFCKSASEYGAFPTDPYSHSPKHSGARQPGMTGQVKEDIIGRFGELGVRIADGKIKFNPLFLRDEEFSAKPFEFSFYDINCEIRIIPAPQRSLAFTLCQTPIILSKGKKSGLSLILKNGDVVSMDSLELDKDYSAELFARSGLVTEIRSDIC